MFDLSFGEIGVIALLILVCFDADQLPELMRQAGRMYAKVRGASDELRRAFNVEVARAESEQRRDVAERRRAEAARARAERPAVADLPARAAPPDAVGRPARGPAPTASPAASPDAAAAPPAASPDAAAPSPAASPDAATPASDDTGGEA